MSGGVQASGSVACIGAGRVGDSETRAFDAINLDCFISFSKLYLDKPGMWLLGHTAMPEKIVACSKPPTVENPSGSQCSL